MGKPSSAVAKVSFLQWEPRHFAKNTYPRLRKTICAESVPFVVVGFPYTACIIFIKIFIEHDDFSPNALKHILCENQAPS